MAPADVGAQGLSQNADNAFMSHVASKGWEGGMEFPLTSTSQRSTRSRSETNRDLSRGRTSRFRRSGAHWDSERATWRATVVLDGHRTHFGSFDSRLEAAAASEAARQDLTALTEPEPGRTAQGALLAVAHTVRALEAVGISRVFRLPTHTR